MADTLYDVAIVGSGPAGYTAALYASRAFLKTLVLSGMQPGGQLTTTTEVDNFPGFPQGILGPTLVGDMKKQAERFGAEVQQEMVTSIAKGDVFTLAVGDKKYQAKTVIIATGASAMYLGLPSEEKLKGKGVSGCATCDGFFFRGKVVVVVGGGDTAMEEATFLTKFCPKVTVIHRREEFRASAIMLDRAKKDPRIAFLTNKVIEEILGETEVTGIRLRDTKTNEVIDYPTQGVFLAIGHKPSTAFLTGLVDLDAKGYVKVVRSLSPLDPQTATNVPGIFAAGDCVDPRYRQAIVAAGQGCMAAMDAEKYLEGLHR
ncbi:MAG: thioredoxin-disulfide reductase [Patescibacteria group bacterium]